MSTHASTKVDQKEYLKKYLSGDTKKKKKKDKKHKIKQSSVKVKIIDDDAHTAKGLDIDEELLLTGEDAPQIVGSYIEEKPNGESTNKWKSIVIKNESEDENLKQRNLEKDDLWGKKSTSNRPEDSFSPQRRERKDSPPRKSKRGWNDDISPPRRKSLLPERHKDTNQSPPKNRGQYSKEKSRNNLEYDQNPPRRKTKEYLDQTPLRRDRKRSTDQSPPRNRRQSPSDKSPVGRKRKTSRDRSPPHRRRPRSFDRSPPRHKEKISTDQSPTRRRKQSPSDQSPARRKIRSPADQSPERHGNSRSSPTRRYAQSVNPFRIKREKESVDLSPQRRKDSDQSPQRRRNNTDQSPPRRPIRSRSPTTTKIKRENSSPDAVLLKRQDVGYKRRTRWQKSTSRSPSPPPTHKPKMNKTLDGKRAGLQDAHALKSETEERRHQEDQFYAKMSNEISGRDAEVQSRKTGGGRLGRRAREARELDPEEQSRKEKHEKQKKELYDRWGKGLKQIEAHQNKAVEEQYESSKPLARYTNDEDLERHLREQEHADDPMLEYMRQKKKERQKHLKEPTIPVYQGSFPENRFSIRPGYRWDGVDRSNGYEKKWFDKQSEKRAMQDEAYKYSVEDM